METRDGTCGGECECCCAGERGKRGSLEYVGMGGCWGEACYVGIDRLVCEGMQIRILGCVFWDVHLAPNGIISIH